MPEVICKNCKKSVDSAEVLCPECGVGLEAGDTADLLDFSDIDSETTDTTTENIDSLLDFDDIDEESDDDIASFLGLDDEDETSRGPAVPTFEESPTVPIFEESPTVPTFEESPSIPTFGEESPAIPSLGEEGPVIPTFDGVTEEKVAEEITSSDLVLETSLLSLGGKRLSWMYFSQWLYWLLVFFLINVASITVISPSLTLDNLLETMIAPAVSPLGESIYVFNSLTINPLLYIFSWLSFFAMGWFHRYRLLQHHVRPKWFHAVIFISGFFVFSLVPAVVFILITPSIIAQLYFVLIPVEVFVTFMTAGVGTYYLGYSFLFYKVFSLTPISKLPDNNLLVEN